MAAEAIQGFLLLALLFVPLEQIFALHRQKTLRPGWWTDVLYYFTGYFMGRLGTGLSVVLVLYGLPRLSQTAWQLWVSHQPLWLQLPTAMVIAELGYYLAHRLLHCIPYLWRFHRIHHSVQHLDWLATVHVHPIDQIFTKLFQMVPLYCLGFSTNTLGTYALISAAIAFFIHANLKLKFGGWRWVIMTPELHHWHHHQDPHVANHNFAAQLPIVDWLFGTLYLPTCTRPDRYGIAQPIPNNYWGQLWHPFQPVKTSEKVSEFKGAS